MRFGSVLLPFLMLSLLSFSSQSLAVTDPSELERSMSDTLDLWRDGRYDQLYESLSHRGKMSKEKFVKVMREISIRPACCWQKMENFKVLREKNSEATVYAKVGLEGTSRPSESVTREFKLSHDSGAWKMRLGDVSGLAGVSGKKAKHGHRKNKPQVFIP